NRGRIEEVPGAAGRGSGGQNDHAPRDAGRSLLVGADIQGICLQPLTRLLPPPLPAGERGEDIRTPLAKGVASMFKERTRLVLSLLILLFLAARVPAVEYRTLNFLVDAPSVEVGRQIGEAAERYRKELAEKWLGKEMPTWDKPCPLRVTVTGTGSGGATSFAF